MTLIIEEITTSTPIITVKRRREPTQMRSKIRMATRRMAESTTRVESKRE
jgi:hypothetical protein